MSHSPSQDDQRTIKRCYYNLHNQKNRPSLTANANCIKKPLNQLFYHHFIHGQNSSTNFEITQNFINFQNSSSQKCLNSNDLTAKFQQKNPQKDQNYSNCCARLFTFMQSTQKEKIIDQNKQNQFHQNIVPENHHFKQSLKLNLHDLPLKLNPKGQTSTKFLKKIDYRLKNKQKQTTEKGKVVKHKQIELLNFIEGSRKKRQQLLIQLQQLDFNCLESLCPDNIKYLTPQERLSKKETPKIRVESSRNCINEQKSNKNFFRKQSNSNDKKCPRVVIKEHLRQRNFSLNSLKNVKASLSPRNVPISQKNKTIRQFYNIKRQNESLKQQVNSFKKNLIQGTDALTDLIKNSLTGKISSRKLRQKEQINNQNLSSKNILPIKKKRTQSITKGQQEEKEKKRIEELIKRKKQLEKELTNLNDDMVLFNRKKKKNLKYPK